MESSLISSFTAYSYEDLSALFITMATASALSKQALIIKSKLLKINVIILI